MAFKKADFAHNLATLTQYNPNNDKYDNSSEAATT